MSFSEARLVRRRQAEEGDGDESGDGREQELAPRQVDVRDIGQLLGPGGEPEPDGRRRADRGAILAIDALAALPLVVRVRMGLRLAVLGAEPALDAFLVVDLELEQIPAAEQAEQGAGRAEVAAPEALLPGVEGDRAEEEEADREPLDEGRMDGPVLEGLGDRSGQAGDAQAVEGAGQVGQGIGQRREHGQGEGAGQEGQRIEIAGQVEPEDGSDEDGDENVVFRGQTGLVLARRLEEFRPLEDERRELVDGAERADPAAKNAAEDDGRGDRDQGENEIGVDEPRRDDGDESQERVEVEEALDGRADVVLAGIVGADEEIDEEAEEDRLARHAEPLEGAVLPRSFFFQGAPFRDRSGPIRAHGPSRDTGARSVRSRRGRPRRRPRPPGPCRRRPCS